MKKFLTIITSLSFLIQSLSYADEGMWLPLLVKRLNYNDMQKLGLRLTAEEIYSVNNSCLKDAIVNFGNFCTGEVISKEGLVLTNHHCGYESIQSHSSVKDNYLANGFWASTRAEEKENMGLSVSFLIRMEDVTAQILGGLHSELKPSEVASKIVELGKQIEAKATEGTHYTAEVKSFFEGNEYYLFVYETFTDIRLVGAPPSSIGKFGGETDNWMWPRHTGDFSMFRIYTGPDGKPAAYSSSNIPYKAKHYLPLSLKGVSKNDFTMVMGYPGNTERYLSSQGVSMLFEQSNPLKIKIRQKRLSIIKQDMDADATVKIKYAAKYAQVINYYKYFIGQNEGLKRLKIVEKKQKEEAAFNAWAIATEDRSKHYGTISSDFDKIYEDNKKVNPIYIYLEEAALGTEILLLAYQFNGAYAALKANTPEQAGALAEAKTLSEDHFKNYNAPTDQKVFAALLELYYHDINKSFHPAIFKVVEKKYKGDFGKFAEAVFKKSIFASQDKMNAFLSAPNAKILEKDPAFQTIGSIIELFVTQIRPFIKEVYEKLERENAIYTKGIMEMKAGKNLYPNANFTMRLSYGTVQDYVPRDAVYYNYFTTLDGIIEKEDSTNEEFMVPPKIKELFNKKDFGKYSKNGKLPVCFITNNDITGGNSGSPVINAEGQLVGTAFDGNWEAMSGDIVYEPELQRCIVTDIRYILFIIDKYAGASNIISELTLVEN